VWTADQRRRSLGERLGHVDDLVTAGENREGRLTEGAYKLVVYLRRLISKLEQTLDSRWQALGVLDDLVREDLRQHLCDEFRDVLALITYELMPVLFGADPLAVPLELETAVVEAVSRADPGGEIVPVLYGSPYPGYAISEHNLNRWLQMLGPTDELLPGFVSLCVPRLERDSVSLHCLLLGHEVGHLWDWRNRITSGIEVGIPGEYQDAGGNLDMRHASAFSRYLDVVQSWFEEFGADTLACLWLGPAAVLALPELAGSLGPPNNDTDTHPATDRRVKLMLEVLRAQGFADVPDLRLVLEAYETQTRDSWDRLPPEGRALPWTFVRGRLDGLLERCRQSVGSAQFAADRWPGVEAAAVLLARGIPCGEASAEKAEPMDTATILNAAWLVKIRDLERLATEVGVDSAILRGSNEVNRVLDELTLKSIEISEYLRQAR